MSHSDQQSNNTHLFQSQEIGAVLVSNLRKQVMSPANATDLIPIELLGVQNYDMWYHYFMQVVGEASHIWSEYVETGDIQSVRIEYGLPDIQIKSMKIILDTNLVSLIKKNVSKDIEKKIRNSFLMTKRSGPTGLLLLEYLKKKYGRKCVKSTMPIFSEVNSASSKPLDERGDWAIKFVNTMFNCSDELDINNFFDDPAIKSAVSAYHEKLQDAIAALLLMAITPELKQKFNDFYGSRTTISYHEVEDMVEDLKTTKPSNVSANVAAFSVP
ncbi:Tkp5 protein [Vanderwaltozyma polyspora DSM 70294]|uniref:Tkp5 protein n=1 Tax=Vanderwaltozyma polyspora (strain ATCC 22028 / DSM 70294 / BCRC 21397 / CBS 2163 / NBRC 10782 / NRRL Y-8283 / UCD 57-17) TaxID=436907 RepID=A7TTV2_VANPO|nr:Tkp5 protein [Vanderwaltozyma polyspora DSM 70294]EDO14304.1 Tkp5 protein [Vanderwaltozyma polyspora DSM 70294]